MCECDGSGKSGARERKLGGGTGLSICLLDENVVDEVVVSFFIIAVAVLVLMYNHKKKKNE